MGVAIIIGPTIRRDSVKEVLTSHNYIKRVNSNHMSCKQFTVGPVTCGVVANALNLYLIGGLRGQTSDGVRISGIVDVNPIGLSWSCCVSTGNEHLDVVNTNIEAVGAVVMTKNNISMSFKGTKVISILDKTCA